MHEAWALLLQSAYSAHVWMTKQAWQGEPSLAPMGQSIDAGPVFAEATEKFFSCAGEFDLNSPKAQLYRNDLIEFVAQTAGGYVDGQLASATEAIRSKEIPTAKVHAEAALAMMGEIDALMNLRPDRRLETWLNAARAQASAPDEAAYYDENARRLITTWGWPELSDYAARWRAWFEHQFTGEPFSLDIWQQAWLSRPYAPSTPAALPDLAAKVRAILAVCRACETSSSQTPLAMLLRSDTPPG
jgi:alpha-N-acetylglucosaminidase